MMHRRGFLASIAILSSLSLVGCSTSQVILDLEIASVAIEVAAPVVAAFSGPAAGVVVGYLNQASAGVQCVLTAAQAPGATTATISAAVGTCLATVVVPNIPGLPANVVSVITAVANAIKALIQKYGPKVGAAPGTPVMPVHLTFKDHRKIKAIEKQLAEAKVKLTAHK